MNRVATCPKCKTGYELDEEDIGHLMECECGCALFACHAHALDSFAIWCSSCRGEHQVRGVDAGSSVQVECGAVIGIPSVLLRAPVGTPELASRAHAELKLQRKSGDAANVHSVPPPVHSQAAKVKGVSDAGSNLVPNGGIGAESITLLADSKVNAASDAIAKSDGHSGALGKGGSETNEGVGKQKKKTPPKRNIVSVFGIMAVAALLLVSVAMFLLRVPPSQKKKSRSADMGLARSDNATQSEGGPELQNDLVIAGDVLAPDIEDSDVATQSGVGLPLTTVASSGADDSLDRGGGSYRLPPPTVYALPTQKQPRELIPVQRSKMAFSSLPRGLETAFEEYAKVQKLKEQSDVSNSKADLNAYQQAVGRTIGVVEQVHEMAVAKAAKEDIATTRYLLAFLYLKAGMLPEAAVMGESVARWGDLTEPSTKEAGMIALAATQELSDMHWGDAEDLGELRQMESVVEILQRRWPDESQNALIWMNVGYLYEAFNQPQNAVRVYENISESSEHYGMAMRTSGLAEWNVLRQQQATTGKRIASEDRKRVKQRLAKGLRAQEKKESGLVIGNLEARLALAQLELISASPEKAEAWLTDDPPALLSSIRVREDDDNESALLVDEAMVRQIYDVLFHALNQQGDVDGATQAIEDLAVLVGDSSEDLAAQRMSILKTAIENLKQSENIEETDFVAAKKMSNQITSDASTVPTSTILWLGESWAQVGERAENNEIAKESARMAAELYGDAILRDGFPRNSLQTAQLRRIELLRRSGEVMQSIKQIEDMLADEPNVFALQIAAAQSLEQVAVEYKRPSDLLAAIDGPSGFSPIWGWGKLVTTLHASLYSAGGTPRHAEQLALAQYHLFRCRYQLASQIKDPRERMQQLADVERALSKRIATMDKKNDWYRKYAALYDQISGRK
jgi:hypothetical protein